MEDANLVFYAIRDRKTGMYVKKTARGTDLTDKIGQARIFSNYKVAKQGYSACYYKNCDLYIQTFYANILPCEEQNETK